MTPKERFEVDLKNARTPEATETAALVSIARALNDLVEILKEKK